jgi:thymidylate synthase (FAD)
MRIIESDVSFLVQGEGLQGLYEHIENCGRTCYKSENNIKEGSAEKFVNAMIKSHHGAMLEHGTVYLELENKAYNAPFDAEYYSIVQKYERNKYSKIVSVPTFVCKNDVGNDVYANAYYITTNLRVLVENGWLDDLKYMCEPTEYHEKRYTLRFICDRGVTHELVRHRKFSFAQESSRYCNYGDDKKFGKELTFICPSWADYEELKYMAEITSKEKKVLQRAIYDSVLMDAYEDNAEVAIETANEKRCELILVYDMLSAERNYMFMINHGSQPQQARQVLPTMIKSEICMTGFASDWRFFFDLRLFGKTGQPHPDMLRIAQIAKEKLEGAGYWDDIMSYSSKFNE